MNRIYLLLASITIVALMLVGCINYDQKTILNADNSGTMQIHYTNDMVDAEVVPDLPFTKNGILNSYPDGYVRDIVVIDEEGRTPEARYFIDFDDIHNLNGFGVFAVGDQIIQTFDVSDKGDTRKFAQTLTIQEVDEGSHLSEYTFTFTLRTPTPVISSNGAVSEDRKTVIWVYELSDIINKTTSMGVIYEKPIVDSDSDGGTDTSPKKTLYLAIIGIAGCLVVIIVFIIIIVIVIGRKKRRGSAAE